MSDQSYPGHMSCHDLHQPWGVLLHINFALGSNGHQVIVRNEESYTVQCQVKVDDKSMQNGESNHFYQISV